jgi:hypothetical protein
MRLLLWLLHLIGAAPKSAPRLALDKPLQESN